MSLFSYKIFLSQSFSSDAILLQRNTKHYLKKQDVLNAALSSDAHFHFHAYNNKKNAKFLASDNSRRRPYFRQPTTPSKRYAVMCVITLQNTRSRVPLWYSHFWICRRGTTLQRVQFSRFQKDGANSAVLQNCHDIFGETVLTNWYLLLFK
jgi:hypothetical protein